MKKWAIIALILIVLIIILLLQEQPSGMKTHSSIYSTDTPQSIGTAVIGSFNIQTFGKTKSGNEEVMSLLAEIACKFDVLAVQEIRDSSGETPINFAKKINETCGNRSFVVSQPLGRTTSKETYMIIYNEREVELVEGSAGAISDTEDLFEREPMIASFKAGELEFTVMNIHIKPEDAQNEISHLSKISESLKSNNNRKIIIVGDFNADCSYFEEKKRHAYFGKEYEWIIPEYADTTTKSTQCTYDQIIITDNAKPDFTGQAGVLLFDKAYGLNMEGAAEVSDHYPVWAEFNVN